MHPNPAFQVRSQLISGTCHFLFLTSQSCLVGVGPLQSPTCCAGSRSATGAWEGEYGPNRKESDALRAPSWLGGQTIHEFNGIWSNKRRRQRSSVKIVMARASFSVGREKTGVHGLPKSTCAYWTGKLVVCLFMTYFQRAQGEWQLKLRVEWFLALLLLLLMMIYLLCYF